MSRLKLTPSERARRYVERVPGAVEGNHGDCQTLAVANALVWDFALNPTEALSILRGYNQRCSPPWTEEELNRKIQSAEKQPHNKPRGHLAGPGNLDTMNRRRLSRATSGTAPKRKINPISATEDFLNGFRCKGVDLWEASPVRPPEDWRQDGACLVAMLFEPDELVNVVVDYSLDGKGKANPKGWGVTLRRNDMIRRLQNGGLHSEAGGWLRMNPLDGRGVSDHNVEVFRFALLECDDVPVELQLPLFARLLLPFAAILSSGGRSIHGWVKVDGANAEDYGRTVDRIRALLARFGVDRKNRNPSRLSRLPGVVRGVGAAGDGRQRLLYLNPQPEPKAIL